VKAFYTTTTSSGKKVYMPIPTHIHGGGYKKLIEYGRRGRI
jgi:hypothetical protein